MMIRCERDSAYIVNVINAQYLTLIYSILRVPSTSRWESRLYGRFCTVRVRGIADSISVEFMLHKLTDLVL